MSKGTYRDMWVYAEHNRGEFVPVTLEMLAEARRLMDKYNQDYKAKEKVVAFVAGHNVGDLAEKALQHGADVAYVVDHPEFEDFRLEPVTKILAKAAQGKDEYKSYDKPRYFLFPATNNGRDLSATAMAALESGLASDCNFLYITDLPIKHPAKTRVDDKIQEITFERILHMKRPDFSGFEWSTILCIDDMDRDFHPQACSVIPGSFKPLPADPSRKGSIVRVPMDLPAEAFRVRTLKREALPIEVDLTKPEILVAVGRGIQRDPTKGLKIGADLAKALGGDVGVSRGIVTAKYSVDPSLEKFTREVRQIGETGQMVKPRLYIALGISGAIQHKKGMDKSRVIVAVNEDGDAPIKEFSDVFVKGDLFEVAPILQARLSAALGGGAGRNGTPGPAPAKEKPAPAELKEAAK